MTSSPQRKEVESTGCNRKYLTKRKIVSFKRLDMMI